MNEISPYLDFGISIIGSSFGRIGFRHIKGKKVWFRMNKLGHWRKLSEQQINLIILDNPEILFKFK